MVREIPLTPKRIDLFWAKVERTEGCWLWTAAALPKGYGRFFVGGKVRVTGAHQFSYQIHFGPIPSSLHVLHRCDNPRCVRPDHLFLGTNLDNIRDMQRKGRGQLGERHPHARLTEAIVREIRQRFASGESTQGQLAREFGICQSAVSNIVWRRRWPHVI